MTTKREMKEIKSILDLFLSQTNGDEVISQERIEWELDFRTHLLNEIQRNFISREKVEKAISKISSQYFLDEEEKKLWKKVFGAVSQKEEEFVNERIRQALLYVSQELLE